jgi:hypothetical protein
MSPDASFFELPEPPDEDELADEFAEPVWMAPPRNELGRTVACDVDLVTTEDLAIAVRGAVAFSTGLLFQLLLRLRRPRRDWLDLYDPLQDDLEAGLSGRLRFGIQLSDGGKATNLDPLPDVDWEEELPDGPALQWQGGGIGTADFSGGYWLWPLPPPGELTFVCEWPAMSVPVTARSVETAPLLAAAARSLPLWELPDWPVPPQPSD